MNLTTQKRLAAYVLGCSKKRVRFDPERLDEIKESITKQDISALINDGAIYRIQKKGISKVRARKIRIQKSNRKRIGPGSRKGKKTSRLPRKRAWIYKMRAQRGLLRSLRSNQIILPEVYRQLYEKAQSGFFRNRRHIKLYIEEQELINKKIGGK